ncbi:MAG TPA: hypothetical protein VGZ91_05035 [Candidatus Sulfotelmatobacter sp.]|jgi:hypothetical protein|nr:hypothetical protein [Candidatus Sulfotelmatobacter sp.]
MNNSSPQGQLFFQNFSSSLIPKGLTVNAVTNCAGHEGVVSMYSVPPSNYTSMNGQQAVIFDMTTDSSNACFNRH